MPLLDDSGFWISIITLILGCFSGTMLMLYRSKCERFSCCCFEMIRNVQVELVDHILENQTQNENVV